jgi:hypothetical protein
VRPFRAGILVDSTSVFRPIVGITASRDGGLIVWPLSIPGRTWEYGRMEVLSGRFAGIPVPIPGMSPSINTNQVVASARPPKIHYHRSGWVTASLTGRPERRSFRASRLDQLHGAHVFSYTVYCPLGIPSRSHKRGDVMGVVTSWPKQMGVHGFDFARRRIPSSVLSQMPSGSTQGILQMDGRPEIALALSSHGADVVVILRFRESDAAELVPGETHGILSVFDTRRLDMDGLSSVVAAWTPNDAPKPVEMTRPHERPFQRWAPYAPAELFQRTRIPTEPPGPRA